MSANLRWLFSQQSCQYAPFQVTMAHHEHFPGPKQRFTVRYGLSPNAQNPFKGMLRNSVFNTFRRVRSQFLYVLVPVGTYWYLWQWAQDYNHWLYTKAGRETLKSFE